MEGWNGERKFVFRAKKGTSEMWEARPRDKERGRGERDIKEREGVEIRSEQRKVGGGKHAGSSVVSYPCCDDSLSWRRCI